MNKEKQHLRVVFECANTHIANSVVFALSTRVPTVHTDTSLYAVLVGGTHSSGRFVFTNVDAVPRDAYDRAMKFAQSQRHGVALISVTPDTVPWDPYSMLLLQTSDTEVSSVQLYENAYKHLIHDYVQHVNIQGFGRTEVLDIISACRLHDDALGQGDSALLEELYYQAELPDVAQKEARCKTGADIYQVYIGFCDDETEGTKLVWRVMAHLLLRQLYIE